MSAEGKGVWWKKLIRTSGRSFLRYPGTSHRL